MNCIILLFLLGCCGGWGNGCGRSCGCHSCGCDCDRCGDGGRGNCGCGRADDCRGNGRGRGTMPGCCDRRDSDRRGGCEEEHHHKHEDCGCAADSRESCGVPGMIPPPWQEYPGFSHRDDRDDCEA